MSTGALKACHFSHFQGNYDENWAEKRFAKENLPPPLVPMSKNVILKTGHQKFLKIGKRIVNEGKHFKINFRFR